LIVALVFEKDANIFAEKLAKIAENCDHNVDPWSHWCPRRAAPSHPPHVNFVHFSRLRNFSPTVSHLIRQILLSLVGPKLPPTALKNEGHRNLDFFGAAFIFLKHTQ
jgi:hypothetical protein